jgi:hypothetical protein
MQIKLGVVVFFIMISVGAFAQTTRDVGPPKPQNPVYQAKKETKFSFLHFKKSKGQQDDAEEFHTRMKKVFKEKAKIEKKMQKPQYTDPSYFGHKRKPKKRPNGKKKFCKECGLTH